MSNQGAGAEPTRSAQSKDQPGVPGPALTPEASGPVTPVPPRSSPEGRTGFLPPGLRTRLRLPSHLEIIDPKFATNFRRYLLQAALAAAAMLAVLLFVDSLSQAALAAGLGSSVVILFVHPTSHAATPRSLVGGHGLALLLGSAFSVLLFAAPVDTFLQDLSPVRNLSLAASLGLLILVMAVTDTEHPPAGATVLGMATRPWELQTTAIIICAVLLLAVGHRLLRSRLRDLG